MLTQSNDEVVTLVPCVYHPPFPQALELDATACLCVRNSRGLARRCCIKLYFNICYIFQYIYIYIYIYILNVIYILFYYI